MDLSSVKTISIKAQIAYFIFATASFAVAKPVTLADRTASASVTDDAVSGGFRVEVVFVPVSTLDSVSNAQMTETMAQFYAEEALSNFVGSPKAVSFTHVKASKKNVDDGRVAWAFLIPANAPIDAPEEVVEIRGEVIGSKKPDLGKPDVKTRLLDFRSSCFRDLRVAETLFLEYAQKAGDDAGRESLRKRFNAALDAFAEKIKNDDSLFRAEKKEMLERAAKVKDNLLDMIENDNSRRHNNDKVASLLVSDATFVEPFGAILSENPILLKSGGARLFDLGDGRIAAIAVGSVSASNDDRDVIAEMLAAAALGKVKGGEEVVYSARTDRNYSRRSDGGGQSERSDYSRSSSTRTYSLDFQKGMEKVGTWLSPDGKKYFVAIGKIIGKRRD